MSHFSRLLRSLTIRKRYHLLNHIARVNGYTRYLEIGVRDPSKNFDRIRVAEKEAVDPAPLAPIAHTMTSDAFFAMMDASHRGQRYDLIFIDGLHVAAQVERDVLNSLRYLSHQGTLVLHDCNPPSREAQAEDVDPAKTKVWTGTVWKAWAKLRATRSDLSMCVVNIDLGCGVIRRGDQVCLPEDLYSDRIDYALLAQRREQILNLVSVGRFLAES